MRIRKDIKLEDIANKLGVSVVTVSNAINNKKGVSVQLRERVLQTVDELGYEIPMRENKTAIMRKLGVIISEKFVLEFQSFYMEIYKNIVKIAENKQCQIILEVVDIKKETLKIKQTSFTDIEVDGIILIGELEKNYINWLKDVCNIPIVGVDFYDFNKNLDYFIVDGFRGMSEMTQKLIDCGHRDIGFVGNPYATRNIMDRYMGYTKALIKNGLEVNKNRLYFDRIINDKEEIINIELPNSDLPTALVCNCDMSAYLVIEKLRDMDIRVPEDISIVGFDNYYYKDIEGLKLTTYENDINSLAKDSVTTLIKRIEKNKKPEGIRTILGKIIEGNTVKDIGGAHERNY